jgi:hypothetical protein
MESRHFAMIKCKKRLHHHRRRKKKQLAVVNRTNLEHVLTPMRHPLVWFHVYD